MTSLSLQGKMGSSRIVIGESLNRLGRYIRPGRLAVVVTDQNVNRLYGRYFSSWPVVTIQPGERSKTLPTVRRIYEKFLRLNVDRNWLVVGVGGGVVCDVAGFAASTYLRGLEFGLAATTLLAQVDAAVGGKNGVNLDGYKNLVGTFSQPSFVICDSNTLKTLPEGEVRGGLAEAIKAAAIADDELFAFLERNLEACLGLNPRAIQFAVDRACRVKVDIVRRDERERDERRKLNFGHTLGHGLEKVCRVSHGEAVAAGMAAAARLSVKKNLLSREEESRLLDLLRRAGLRLAIKAPRGLLRNAIFQDKKRENRRIRFVFLRRLGRAVVQEIDPDEILEVADDLC